VRRDAGPGAFATMDGEAIDVNARLVRQGFAWRYVRYSDDPKLKAAEAAARRDRGALWADLSPAGSLVPPQRGSGENLCN